MCERRGGLSQSGHWTQSMSDEANKAEQIATSTLTAVIYGAHAGSMGNEVGTEWVSQRISPTEWSYVEKMKWQKDSKGLYTILTQVLDWICQWGCYSRGFSMNCHSSKLNWCLPGKFSYVDTMRISLRIQCDLSLKETLLADKMH